MELPFCIGKKLTLQAGCTETVKSETVIVSILTGCSCASIITICVHFNSSEAKREATKAEEGAARRLARVRVRVLGVVPVDDVGDGRHDEVCV